MLFLIASGVIWKADALGRLLRGECSMGGKAPWHEPASSGTTRRMSACIIDDNPSTLLKRVKSVAKVKTIPRVGSIQL